jgi:hypothetical protein
MEFHSLVRGWEDLGQGIVPRICCEEALDCPMAEENWQKFAKSREDPWLSSSSDDDFGRGGGWSICRAAETQMAISSGGSFYEDEDPAASFSGSTELGHEIFDASSYGNHHAKRIRTAKSRAIPPVRLDDPHQYGLPMAEILGNGGSSSNASRTTASIPGVRMHPIQPSVQGDMDAQRAERSCHEESWKRSRAALPAYNITRSAVSKSKAFLNTRRNSASSRHQAFSTANSSGSQDRGHPFFLGRVYGVFKFRSCSVGWAVYGNGQNVGMGERQEAWHYFSVDETLKYHSISDDFGPLNIVSLVLLWPPFPLYFPRRHRTCNTSIVGISFYCTFY